MNQLKFVKFLIFSMLFFSVSIPISSTASDTGFSVAAVLPENQMDNGNSYFDLKVEAGKEQNLQVQLINKSNEEKKISIEANTAITNDNGIVDYQTKLSEKDSSLKVDFSDIVMVENEIILPSNSTIFVPITIKMPVKEFDGIILGGLYFTEKNEKINTNLKKGNQVKSQFGYVIGVKLQETDTEVMPELKLQNISLGQRNNRNVFKINIQNNQPAILKEAKITGEINQFGNKKVLYKETNNSLKMAPNSNFNFQIPLSNSEFKSGKYVFKGIINSQDKTWKFEKEFEVKSEQAQKLNATSVDLQNNNSMITIYISIILLATMVAVFLLWFVRYRK